MKLTSQVYHGQSDDETVKDEEPQEESEDSDEEGNDEGDEVDDSEDFTDDKESEFNGIVKKALHNQSLDGVKNKVTFKKPTIIKKQSTQQMVDEAIKGLNERSGSSVEAIKKFILNKNAELNEKRLRLQIKRYIDKSVADGTIVQIKRSFKLTNKHNMKKKQKLQAKKDKQKELKKIEKPDGKVEEVKKLVETKTVAKKEETSKKTKEKAEVVKTPKEENVKVKAKLVKTTENKKDDKPTETTKSKNRVDKKKLESKPSRKSITYVVKPAALVTKNVKNTKTIATVSKTKTKASTKESPVVATNTVAVKKSGRGKKEQML